METTQAGFTLHFPTQQNQTKSFNKPENGLKRAGAKAILAT
jgi:hypothetical protein